MCAQSLSHVWLLVTPWTVACQSPLSLEFSRQEYWSGLPFPPPGSGGGLVTKSCLTLAVSWTVPCQASLSMEFSRQEYWSSLVSFSRGSSQLRYQTWVSCTAGGFFPDWATSSRGSSQPRDWTCVSCVSCIGSWILYHCATWEAHVYLCCPI